MKYRLALVAALTLALAGCGSSSPTPNATLPVQPSTSVPAPTIDAEQPSQPPSEGPPQQGQVGAPLTVTSGAKVSKVTILSAKYSTEPLGYSNPRKGGFLVLDVLWESEKGTADVNPSLFHAKDATGVQQSSTYVDVDLLASAQVPPGDKLRGAVVFDIGPGPWIVTMGLFSEAARWTITP